jgi:hypothetical protein
LKICFGLNILFYFLLQDNHGYNILSDHHQHNWTNLPPAPAHLATSAAGQTCLFMPSNSNSSHSGDESESEISKHPHNVKTVVTREVKYDTLAHWQGGWKNVVIRSKAEYEYHIACNQFFPICENDLHDASLIITRQINAVINEETVLDNSKHFSSIIFIFLTS